MSKKLRRKYKKDIFFKSKHKFGADQLSSLVRLNKNLTEYQRLNTVIGLGDKLKLVKKTDIERYIVKHIKTGLIFQFHVNNLIKLNE